MLKPVLTRQGTRNVLSNRRGSGMRKRLTNSPLSCQLILDIAALVAIVLIVGGISLPLDIFGACEI